MSELIFGDIEVSKKQFYEGKKSIKLKDVDVGKIVVSNKAKRNNDAIEVFIGYMDDTDVIPLCLIWPK